MTGPNEELVLLRRELHSRPELAFREVWTSATIADFLERHGIPFERNIAGTGIVATLHKGTGSHAIGLRADMDALPIQEVEGPSYRSRHDGVMHACGHDGHVAMLLGAAAVLSRADSFDGTVHFVFQPAEELEGGAQAMIDAGLMDRYPMDAIFALHNWPGLEAGHLAIHEGPVMAALDTFEIRVVGAGGHAARPNEARDVVLAASCVIQALHSIVSRDIDPHRAAVLSVTRVHAGTNDNVLPAEAELGGTVRSLDSVVRQIIRQRMQQVCDGIAVSHRVDVRLVYRSGYPATVNDGLATEVAKRAARDIFPPGAIHTDLAPSMASEDFAYFAGRIPACYAWLGNGVDMPGLHSASYDFNDSVIPFGVRYWVRIAETALPTGPTSV